MTRAPGLLAIVFFLSSCGGGQSGGGGAGSGSGTGGESPPPETAAELEGFDAMETIEVTSAHQAGAQSAREAIGLNSPPQPWDSMSRPDQEYWMISNVLPIHAEMFRGWNATRYAEFTCGTCHGDDATERNYEMPSQFLPPLPASGTPAWAQLQERNPGAMQFMSEQVMPAIRTQIGEPEASCYTCHPRAGG